MNNQKGVIHLVVPLLLLLALGAGVFFLIFYGVIKNPLNNLPILKNLPILQQSSSASIKSEYKNPFKKDTQYVNPFETYKNPFAIAK